MTDRRTLGLILAGGLARRMGGGDKPLREIGGRTLLDHVIGRLAPQVERMVLNINGDPARFAPWGLPSVADSVPDFAGPLAGILAGLDHAAALPGVTHVLSVAGDTPFFPNDLAARLHAASQALEGSIQAVDAESHRFPALAVAASGGFSHPVIGLWPVAITGDLRHALLQEGERKIDRFTARYPLATVEWPVEPFDPFFNANRVDDLAEAERLLALAG
jgi:molybdopterin-guanine dinucleotide biosynthesis protein A